MLLCYALVENLDQKRLEPTLSLVSEEFDPITKPFPISLLRPSTQAVYRVGPKEAVTVIEAGEPNAILICPVGPAPIYLTPECPMQPGFRIKTLKLLFEPNNVRVFYITKEAVGEQWKEWVANRQKA